MADKDDHFFIGWEGEPAPLPVRHSRLRSMLLIGIGIGIVAAAAALQTNFASKASWNLEPVQFEGVLIAEPYPTLISGEQVYYIGLETKHALSKEAAAPFHLKQVKIDGTLIEDPDQQVAMIALRDADAIRTTGESSANPLAGAGPGRLVTLRGEIADSKCALGAMNPGVFKPHRACAIACISGGLPPVLIVRHEGGGATHYLITDESGGAVNEEVLPHVAIPVQVTGMVIEVGEWKILRTPIDEIVPLR